MTAIGSIVKINMTGHKEIMTRFYLYLLNVCFTKSAEINQLFRVDFVFL